jgi:hypothetical protein
MIRKKLRAPLRKHLRLVLHILPAACHQQQRTKSRKRKRSSAGSNQLPALIHVPCLLLPVREANVH